MFAAVFRLIWLIGLVLSPVALAQNANPVLDLKLPEFKSETGERRPETEIRAQLKPARKTVLSTEISGVLRSLPLGESDRFKKGARLAVIDCAIHRARLARSVAELEAAQKIATMTRRLAELDSIGEIEVTKAVANTEKARAERNVMRAVVSKCVVSAPFAGTVTQTLASQHQYVAEGEKLLEIHASGQLDIELIVPSVWLRWLAVGTRFVLHVDETGKSYPSTVEMLGATIDPVSQSIRITGKIDGDQGGLRPGMSGRAEFPEQG